MQYTLAMQPFYAPEFTLKGAAAVRPQRSARECARQLCRPRADLQPRREAIAYTWSDYYDRKRIPLRSLRPGMAPADAAKELLQQQLQRPDQERQRSSDAVHATVLGAVTQNQKNDPWSCWLHYNNPATMSLPVNTSVPILYVTGDKDTTVIPAANDPVMTSWCQKGPRCSTCNALAPITCTPLPTRSTTCSTSSTLARPACRCRRAPAHRSRPASAPARCRRCPPPRERRASSPEWAGAQREDHNLGDASERIGERDHFIGAEVRCPSAKKLSRSPSSASMRGGGPTTTATAPYCVKRYSAWISS